MNETTNICPQHMILGIFFYSSQGCPVNTVRVWGPTPESPGPHATTPVENHNTNKRHNMIQHCKCCTQHIQKLTVVFQDGVQLF